MTPAWYHSRQLCLASRGRCIRWIRLREEGAEATIPALTEPAAVVADGGSPAEGGSPKGADLALVADPAPGECLF